MREQSGRSLIEIIGYLAIAGILMAGVITTYNVIRNRQVRVIATATIEQIAKNTKLLMELRGSYNGVSVDYLIKSGALKNNKSPIGGAEWSVTPSIDGKEFLINLTDLSKGECDYFTTVKMEFAARVKVNGYESDPGTYCLTTGANELSIIVQ